MLTVLQKTFLLVRNNVPICQCYLKSRWSMLYLLLLLVALLFVISYLLLHYIIDCISLSHDRSAYRAVHTDNNL